MEKKNNIPYIKDIAKSVGGNDVAKSQSKQLLTPQLRHLVICVVDIFFTFAEAMPGNGNQHSRVN